MSTVCIICPPCVVCAQIWYTPMEVPQWTVQMALSKGDVIEVRVRGVACVAGGCKLCRRNNVQAAASLQYSCAPSLTGVRALYIIVPLRYVRRGASLYVCGGSS